MNILFYSTEFPTILGFTQYKPDVSSFDSCLGFRCGKHCRLYTHQNSNQPHTKKWTSVCQQIYKDGPGGRSWYIDSMRAGRSGDRISVGGKIFSTRPHRPWGPPSLLYNVQRVSFPEVKQSACGVYQPPPSRVQVKERVQPITLLHLRTFMTHSRITFTLLKYKHPECEFWVCQHLWGIGMLEAYTDSLTYSHPT